MELPERGGAFYPLDTGNRRGIDCYSLPSVLNQHCALSFLSRNLRVNGLTMRKERHGSQSRRLLPTVLAA